MPIVCISRNQSCPGKAAIASGGSCVSSLEALANHSGRKQVTHDNCPTAITQPSAATRVFKRVTSLTSSYTWMCVWAVSWKKFLSKIKLTDLWGHRNGWEKLARWGCPVWSISGTLKRRGWSFQLSSEKTLVVYRYRDYTDYTTQLYDIWGLYFSQTIFFRIPLNQPLRMYNVLLAVNFLAISFVEIKAYGGWSEMRRCKAGVNLSNEKQVGWLGFDWMIRPS